MSEVLYFLFIGILFYVMMRWGCGAHMMGGGHDGHSEKPTEGGQATPVHDPVCGMELDARKASYSKPYRGGLYYFCSGECQEKFIKNPEGYIQVG